MHEPNRFLLSPIACVFQSCPRLAMALLLGIALSGWSAHGAERPPKVRVWPAQPPGDWPVPGDEHDTTGEDGGKVAGQRVMRITNVAEPTLELFPPAPENNTGAAVLICPGGGHRILAYDLEGTEVADWLASIGVTGIVLKYRVPAPNPDRRWEAAVQDAQRAMIVTRANAEQWGIDPERVGILGFSAGGQTAALTALTPARHYDAQDDWDTQHDFRPNFGVLVYPAYLANEAKTGLVGEATVNEQSPPLFLAHAFNDPVPVENSVLLYLAMKRVNRPAELHAYASGGHGFGMRATEEPCSRWPMLCEQWMRHQGWLTPATEAR
jgi:acetyl esterase/lipase